MPCNSEFLPDYTERDRNFNAVYCVDEPYLTRQGRLVDRILNTPNPTLPFVVKDDSGNDVEIGAKTLDNSRKILQDPIKPIDGYNVSQLWLSTKEAVIKYNGNFAIAGSKNYEAFDKDELKAYFKFLGIASFLNDYALRRLGKKAGDTDTRIVLPRTTPDAAPEPIARTPSPGGRVTTPPIDATEWNKIEELSLAALREVARLEKKEIPAHLKTVDEVLVFLGKPIIKDVGDFRNLKIDELLDYGLGFYKAFSLFLDSNFQIIAIPTSLENGLKELRIRIESYKVNFAQAPVSKGLGFIDDTNPEDKDHRACFNFLLRLSQGEVCQFDENYRKYLNTFLRFLVTPNKGNGFTTTPSAKSIAGFLKTLVGNHSPDPELAMTAVMMNFELSLEYADPELRKQFTDRLLNDVWKWAFANSFEGTKPPEVNIKWAQEKEKSNPILVLKRFFEIDTKLIAASLFSGSALASSLPNYTKSTVLNNFDAALTRHFDKPMMEIVMPFSKPQPHLDGIQKGHSIFVDFKPLEFAKAINQFYILKQVPYDSTKRELLQSLFVKSFEGILENIGRASPIEEQKQFLQLNEAELIGYISFFLSKNDPFLTLCATSLTLMLVAAGSTNAKHILFTQCVQQIAINNRSLSQKISSSVLPHLAPERKLLLSENVTKAFEGNTTAWFKALILTKDTTLCNAVCPSLITYASQQKHTSENFSDLVDLMEHLHAVDTPLVRKTLLSLFDILNTKHLSLDLRTKFETLLSRVKKEVKTADATDASVVNLRKTLIESRKRSLAKLLSSSEEKSVFDVLTSAFNSTTLDDTGRDLLFKLLFKQIKQNSLTHTQIAYCLGLSSTYYIFGKADWMKCLMEWKGHVSAETIALFLKNHPFIINQLIASLSGSEKSDSIFANYLHENNILRNLYPNPSEYWSKFTAIVPFLSNNTFWSQQIEYYNQSNKPISSDNLIKIYVQPFDFFQRMVVDNHKASPEEQRILRETLLAQYPSSDVWPQLVAQQLSSRLKSSHARLQATLLLEELLGNQIAEDNYLQLWERLNVEEKNLLELRTKHHFPAAFLTQLIMVAELIGNKTGSGISKRDIAYVDLLKAAATLLNHYTTPGMGFKAHIGTLIKVFETHSGLVAGQKGYQLRPLNDDEIVQFHEKVLPFALSEDAFLQILSLSLLALHSHDRISAIDESLYCTVLPLLVNAADPLVRKFALSVAKKHLLQAAPEKERIIDLQLAKTITSEAWFELLSATGHPQLCAWTAKHFSANVPISSANFNVILTLLKNIGHHNIESALHLLTTLHETPLPFKYQQSKQLILAFIALVRKNVSSDKPAMDLMPLIHWINSFISETKDLSELPLLEFLYQHIKTNQPSQLVHCIGWLPHIPHERYPVLGTSELEVATNMMHATQTGTQIEQLNTYLHSIVSNVDIFPLLNQNALKMLFANTSYLRDITTAYMRSPASSVMQVAKLLNAWLNSKSTATDNKFLKAEEITAIIEKMMLVTPIQTAYIIKLIESCLHHPLFEDKNLLKPILQRLVATFVEQKTPAAQLCLNLIVDNELIDQLEQSQHLAFLNLVVEQSSNASFDKVVRYAEKIQADNSNRQLWINLFNALHQIALSQATADSLLRLKALSDIKDCLNPLRLQLEMDVLEKQILNDQALTNPALQQLLDNKHLMSDSQIIQLRTLILHHYKKQITTGPKELCEWFISPVVQSVLGQTEWNRLALDLLQAHSDQSLATRLIDQLSVTTESNPVLNEFCNYLIGNADLLYSRCNTPEDRWNRLKLIKDRLSIDSKAKWNAQSKAVIMTLPDQLFIETIIKLDPSEYPVEMSEKVTQAVITLCNKKESQFDSKIIEFFNIVGHQIELLGWQHLHRLALRSKDAAAITELVPLFHTYVAVPTGELTFVEKETHYLYLRESQKNQLDLTRYCENLNFSLALLETRLENKAICSTLLRNILKNGSIAENSAAIATLRKHLPNADVNALLIIKAIEENEEELGSLLIEFKPEECDINLLAEFAMTIDHWKKFPTLANSLQQLLVYTSERIPQHVEVWLKVMRHRPELFLSEAFAKLVSGLLKNLTTNAAKAHQKHIVLLNHKTVLECLTHFIQTNCMDERETIGINNFLEMLAKYKILPPLDLASLWGKLISTYLKKALNDYKNVATEDTFKNMETALNMYINLFHQIKIHPHYKSFCTAAAYDILFALYEVDLTGKFYHYSDSILNKILNPNKRPSFTLLPPNTKCPSFQTQFPKNPNLSSDGEYLFQRVNFLKRLVKVTPQNIFEMKSFSAFGYGLIITILDDLSSDKLLIEGVVSALIDYIFILDTNDKDANSQHLDYSRVIFHKAKKKGIFKDHPTETHYLNYFLEGVLPAKMEISAFIDEFFSFLFNKNALLLMYIPELLAFFRQEQQSTRNQIFLSFLDCLQKLNNIPQFLALSRLITGLHAEEIFGSQTTELKDSLDAIDVHLETVGSLADIVPLVISDNEDLIVATLSTTFFAHPLSITLDDKKYLSSNKFILHFASYLTSLLKNNIFNKQDNPESNALLWQKYSELCQTLCKLVIELQQKHSLPSEFLYLLLEFCIAHDAHTALEPTLEKRRTIAFKAIEAAILQKSDNVIEDLLGFIEEEDELLDDPAYFYQFLPESCHSIIPELFFNDPDALDDTLQSSVNNLKDAIQNDERNLAQILLHTRICIDFADHVREFSGLEEIFCEYYDLLSDVFMYFLDNKEFTEAAKLFIDLLDKNMIPEDSEDTFYKGLLTLLEKENHVEPKVRETLFKETIKASLMINEPFLEEKKQSLEANIDTYLPPTEGDTWQIRLINALVNCWDQGDFDLLNWALPIINLFDQPERENVWINGIQKAIAHNNSTACVDILYLIQEELIKHPDHIDKLFQAIHVILNSNWKYEDLDNMESVFSFAFSALLEARIHQKLRSDILKTLEINETFLIQTKSPLVEVLISCYFKCIQEDFEQAEKHEFQAIYAFISQVGNENIERIIENLALESKEQAAYFLLPLLFHLQNTQNTIHELIDIKSFLIYANLFSKKGSHEAHKILESLFLIFTNDACITAESRIGYKSEDEFRQFHDVITQREADTRQFIIWSYLQIAAQFVVSSPISTEIWLKHFTRALKNHPSIAWRVEWTESIREIIEQTRKSSHFSSAYYVSDLLKLLLDKKQIAEQYANTYRQVLYFLAINLSAWGQAASLAVYHQSFAEKDFEEIIIKSLNDQPKPQVRCINAALKLAIVKKIISKPIFEKLIVLKNQFLITEANFKLLIALLNDMEEQTSKFDTDFRYQCWEMALEVSARYQLGYDFAVLRKKENFESIYKFLSVDVRHRFLALLYRSVAKSKINEATVCTFINLRNRICNNIETGELLVQADHELAKQLKQNLSKQTYITACKALIPVLDNTNITKSKELISLAVTAISQVVSRYNDFTSQEVETILGLLQKIQIKNIRPKLELSKILSHSNQLFFSRKGFELVNEIWKSMEELHPNVSPDICKNFKQALHKVLHSRCIYEEKIVLRLTEILSTKMIQDIYPDDYTTYWLHFIEKRLSIAITSPSNFREIDKILRWLKQHIHLLSKENYVSRHLLKVIVVKLTVLAINKEYKTKLNQLIPELVKVFADRSLTLSENELKNNSHLKSIIPNELWAKNRLTAFKLHFLDGEVYESSANDKGPLEIGTWFLEIARDFALENPSSVIALDAMMKAILNPSLIGEHVHRTFLGRVNDMLKDKKLSNFLGHFPHVKGLITILEKEGEVDFTTLDKNGKLYLVNKIAETWLANPSWDGFLKTCQILERFGVQAKLKDTPSFISAVGTIVQAIEICKTKEDYVLGTVDMFAHLLLSVKVPYDVFIKAFDLIETVFNSAFESSNVKILEDISPAYLDMLCKACQKSEYPQKELIADKISKLYRFMLSALQKEKEFAIQEAYLKNNVASMICACTNDSISQPTRDHLAKLLRNMIIDVSKLSPKMAQCIQKTKAENEKLRKCLEMADSQ